MTPQFLDLRPECLDSPSQMDVAIVGATMLWPSSKATREKYLTSIAIDLMLRSGNYPQPTSPAEFAELVDITRSTPRVSQMNRPVQKAMQDGMIAGSIVVRTIAADTKAPGQTVLGAIKATLASRFSAAEHVHSKTIENRIWKNYRCVAPYWAAYIFQQKPGSQIPCDPANLGKFLAVAEAIRIRGEAVRTVRSREVALLRVGGSILPPPDLKLPACRIGAA